MRMVILFTLCSLSFACSTSERKLYIHPPDGTTVRSTDSPVTLEVKNSKSGETRKLSLPIQHSPEVLKVIGSDISRSHEAATAADEDFLPAVGDQEGIGLKTANSAPTEPGVWRQTNAPERLSYLRGIELVNELYAKKRYSDALTRLAPLIDQYPNQVRLLVMRGTIYRRIREPRAALKAYQMAARLDGANADLQTLISQLQLELGEGTDND